MDARAVANYLLRLSFSKGVKLTPMQLLKLVYIAHGWHLAYFNKPLIDNPVEAWRYGPVIRPLYESIRKYGKEPITELIPFNGSYGESDSDYGFDSLPDKYTKDLLDHVFKAYGKKSGLFLSDLTHKKGTPWDQVWNDCGGSSSGDVYIPDDVIKSHYVGMLESAREAERV